MTFEINSKNAPKTQFLVGVGAAGLSHKLYFQSVLNREHKTITPEIAQFFRNLKGVIYNEGRQVVFAGFSAFSKAIVQCVNDFIKRSPNFGQTLFEFLKTDGAGIDNAYVSMVNETGVEGVVQITLRSFLLSYLCYSETFRKSFGDDGTHLGSYKIKDSRVFYGMLTKAATPTIPTGNKVEEKVDTPKIPVDNTQTVKQKIPTNLAYQIKGIFPENTFEKVDVPNDGTFIKFKHKITQKVIVITIE
jgi:hypothetical protein